MTSFERYVSQIVGLPSPANPLSLEADFMEMSRSRHLSSRGFPKLEPALIKPEWGGPTSVRPRPPPNTEKQVLSEKLEERERDAVEMRNHSFSFGDRSSVGGRETPSRGRLRDGQRGEAKAGR